MNDNANRNFPMTLRARWASRRSATTFVAGLLAIGITLLVGGETARPEASRSISHRAVPARSLPSFPQAVEIDLAHYAATSTMAGDASGNATRATAGDASHVRLCQFEGRVMHAVDCQDCYGQGEPPWSASRPLPWQIFAQGEYIGPHRTPHVHQYRLRPYDELEFVFRFTHGESAAPYRFETGDELMIESLTDPTLNKGDLVSGRGLMVQPDGTITLPLVGQVPAARRTVEEVRRDLNQRFVRYYEDPAITVTPIKTNTRLEDLRATVDGRFGQGGQVRPATVTPDGFIQLPAIHSIPALGLTLEELRREIEERYFEVVGPGVEVTPALTTRAPTYVYVLGEVDQPDRYALEGPTTVMGAIALAGGWNNGGNLREVVVFRRTEDWRLIATKLDLRGALLGKKPCPADEIWVRDADIVLVPKSPILLLDDFIDLVFTRGIYGVLPVGVNVSLSGLSTL